MGISQDYSHHERLHLLISILILIHIIIGMHLCIQIILGYTAQSR